ncbi:MAG TPA: SDR family oxidoreductase [Fastidiosipila sp.]|nr:SDR family oxidoreductase [Fastidiosipila sp.]
MQTVLLTGISSGIGKEIARQLKAQGIRVIGTDLYQPQDASIFDHFIAADFRDRSALDPIIEYILQEDIRLTGFVHNAMLYAGGLDRCDYESFMSVYAVSVAAPYYLCQQLNDTFAPGMSIVLIGSTRYLQSQPFTESYSAAKGGLYSLNHALAMSLRGKARVNLIAPGWIDSKGEGPFSVEDKASQPVGRVGQPSDVASLCRFLLSDEAGFITGAVFPVDGGMTRQMIYPGDFGWDYKTP